MRVGVGLPNVIEGVGRQALVAWAKRAHATGVFASLGSLHREAWDVPGPLEALAAVAGETPLDLVTMVAVAPLFEAERLAKEAAEVDEACGGRLHLGLSVGARAEDYAAAGVPTKGRGIRFEEQLVALRDLWEAEGRRVPQVLVGGTADVAFARAARWGDGYVHGGGPPRALRAAVLKTRAAWAEFGRPGAPRIWGQSYFALGDAADEGLAYMRSYYAFTGPFVERIAEDLLTTPQQVAARVRGYAEAGCEDLVLIPTTADPVQVDLLAEVLSA